jgi:hypothetical protein
MEPRSTEQQVRGLALLAVIVLLVIAVRYFLRWV